MNGILVINKKANYTSRDVVNIISKIFNTKKVGHTGTLDPLAEGVLVCTIGKCTKLCNYLTSETKEYITEFVFGYETDTLDITGNTINKLSKIPSYEELIKALKHFNTSYMQEVPLYSAVKVNGKKLYEYARNKETIKLPKKLVKIEKITLLNYENNKAKIKVVVSKGTYIRSLIRDIGHYLNTYATMISLIRTKQGPFKIENSYTLEDIKNNNYKLITIEEIFSSYPKIEVTEDMKKKIINGQELINIYNSNYILFTYQNNLIALYEKKEQNKIKPLILV